MLCREPEQVQAINLFKITIRHNWTLYANAAVFLW